MADNEQIQIVTAEEYIQSISPNANVSELTEKQKDLALAYLLIRIAFNPIMSQRVTDRDGDWEHSEGSEQWSRSQLLQFLILARDLLAKWDITDARIESLAPKWGMKGTGFRKIRRYPR